MSARVPQNGPAGKPAKPYPEFPLYAHASGQWAKRVKGRLVYFGAWADPQAALGRYLDEIDALKAGRVPRRRQTDAVTIRDVLNRFDAAKVALAEAGEITEQWLRELRRTTDLLAEHFDKWRAVDDLTAEDFEGLRAVMARRWGPVRLANAIQQTRSVFMYAYEAGLIDKPVRFGSGFKKPSARVQRVARAKRGRRDFQDPAELRALLEGLPRGKPSDNEQNCSFMTSDTAALFSIYMRAWILLGINCAMGQSDCVGLPVDAVDLAGRWIDYARQKTGIGRRIPIWQETAEAIEAAIKVTQCYHAETADKSLVFLGIRGEPLDRRRVDHAFAELKTDHTFYDLRRTFQTLGDQVSETATRSIMGHAAKSNDMSAVYRQAIPDSRLKAVTDFIHDWLFGSDLTRQKNDR